MRLSHFVLAAALAVAAASTLPAQQVPDGFVVDTIVGEDLTSPIDYAFLDDGRIIIAERTTGHLKLWVPGSALPLHLVGTIPDIDSTGERGLTSICLDPNFVTNGYLYAWSSRLSTGTLHLSRHTLVGDRSNGSSTNLDLDALSERTLIGDAPDDSPIRNGGCLRFGPDNHLYLTIGDDLDACEAQNRTTMQGVLLRMRTSSIPAGGGTTNLGLLVPFDNPLGFSPNIQERLVIGWGFRSPFSMCVDPVTGDLFIGDVGSAMFEELDRYERNLGNVPLARNFGWPVREGYLPGPNPCGAFQSGPFTDPIAIRTYATNGFAIMAAGIYRNLGGADDWGPEYEKNLFHSDYITGTLVRLVPDGPSSWSVAPDVPGQPSPAFFGSGFGGCIRSRLGPDGSLWFLDLVDGQLRRIRRTLTDVHVAIHSGNGQVGVRDGAFKFPFVFEVKDPLGNLMPNVDVDVEVSANGLALNGTSHVTDELGRISIDVVAIAGGQVNVTASLATTGAGVTSSGFARALEMQRVQTPSSDVIVCNVINTSHGSDPVPFLLAMSATTVPVVGTPLGDLGVDLFGFQDTVVIEDGLGLFGGIGFLGSEGNPSRTNVYVADQGLLSGALRFQAMFFDPKTPTSVLGTADLEYSLSNYVELTF